MLITDFTEKIQFVKQTTAGVPKKLEIDLSIVQNDFAYDISGNVFYLFSSANETDYIGIKINETREPMVNYPLHSGLITPFYRLYITTPAGQTGTLTILYATEAPGLMEIIDNRSTTTLGLLDILEELQGDVLPEITGTYPAGYNLRTVGVAAINILPTNANRKGCWIQASSANTGLIYLGFTNTVGAGFWFAELQAGMGWGVDDYRGPIWAISNLALQYAGAGEW